MKERLLELVRSAPTPLHARNAVREYLQARILGSMQRAGAMVPLAFLGGTALRFLYTIQRYSEDLDFALERNRNSYDFRAYLRSIRAEGYAVSLKVSDQKTVHSAFVRFAGLLHETGLSPHRDEVLAVKIEVDTNPPFGAGLPPPWARCAADKQRATKRNGQGEGKLAQRGGRSTAQAGLGSCPQRRPPADRDRRRLAPAHVGQYATVTQRTA